MEGQMIGKKSGLDRFLDAIERVGNKLPHPVSLFIILATIVTLVSWICSAAGVSAINPANGETIVARNLFSVDGIRYLWTNVIKNYANFAPLGMVLVAVIGSACAEKSGFLIALMHALLGGAKGWIVTMVVIFLGINLNVAGDSGFIVLPPLAAILFMSVGRHPLLGMYTGFASVSAGFCANILLGLSDALAYGFTEQAARMIDPNFTGTLAINWYFMTASCFVLTIAGTLLVEKVLVHRFPITKEQLEKFQFSAETSSLTPEQKRGLRSAILALIAFTIVIVLLSTNIITDTPILGDETGSITASKSPFSTGIVFTVALALFVPGFAYGVSTGRYKKDKDLWNDITEGFKEMGAYVFLCFFVSIFTNFFGTTRLGTILAIKGSEFLKNIGFVGIPLMIGLIALTSFINIFIGSASAKWAILAPVYVPMMMLMGYHPAIIQAVYRVGDSLTNGISPLGAYLVVTLSFAKKYDEKVGIGTVIANVIPFSLTFAITWTILVVLWIMFDIPLGPGGVIYL